MEATQQTSVKQLFRSWAYLERRKKALLQHIEHQQERYLSLSLRITGDGIMSSIVQQTRDIDMPRGADISDRTGNLVATVMDGQQEAMARREQLRLEYVAVCDKLALIESYVAGLSERYAQVATSFWREKLPWQEICQRQRVEKSRMYEILEEVVTTIDRERVMWG